MTDNDEGRILINIPADENYIEILGHRIDGFESFEAFCEFLKNYAVLEETVNRQKAEIEKLREHIELLEIENEAIKISVIKELAKKVKDDITTWNFDFTYYSDILEASQRIDNIAKRMVGENK